MNNAIGLNERHEIHNGSITFTVADSSHYSPAEMSRIVEDSKNGIQDDLRNCTLAALNSGIANDDPTDIFARYSDFSLDLKVHAGTLKMTLENFPNSALVDSELIGNIHNHIRAVVRDVVYARSLSDIPESRDRIHAMLKNSGAFSVKHDDDRIVIWGGHSVSDDEYDFAKEAGYQLGLRNFDITTGSGPGIMKAPMKGAILGRWKSRSTSDLQLMGFTEPGIISAEAPNGSVNRLCIFPNIEERLEAFVRANHIVSVFPGGVGTAEEVMYILGTLLHPKNTVDSNPSLPVPVYLTGETSSEGYFTQLNDFIGKTLGEKAQARYEVLTGSKEATAKELAVKAKQTAKQVREYRKDLGISSFFNSEFYVPEAFSKPFNPTHESMASLKLDGGLHDNASSFAADLRRAFSGIVGGNVKPDVVKRIKEHGNFNLRGSKKVTDHLDALLEAFCKQGRMKIEGEYTPCYSITEA